MYITYMYITLPEGVCTLIVTYLIYTYIIHTHTLYKV